MADGVICYLVGCGVRSCGFGGLMKHALTLFLGGSFFGFSLLFAHSSPHRHALEIIMGAGPSRNSGAGAPPQPRRQESLIKLGMRPIRRSTVNAFRSSTDRIKNTLRNSRASRSSSGERSSKNVPVAQPQSSTAATKISVPDFSHEDHELHNRGPSGKGTNVQVGDVQRPSRRASWYRDPLG